MANEERKVISSEEAWKALDDADSVVEISLNFGSLGGSTEEGSGIVFEKRPKIPEDDLDLGILPDLLADPDLAREVFSGKLVDPLKSNDPRIRKLIEEYRAKVEATPGYENPYLPPVQQNPLSRAWGSIIEGARSVRAVLRNFD